MIGVGGGGISFKQCSNFYRHNFPFRKVRLFWCCYSPETVLFSDSNTVHWQTHVGLRGLAGPYVNSRCFMCTVEQVRQGGLAKYLLLDSRYLGLKNFCMWINPGLFHCIYGHLSIFTMPLFVIFDTMGQLFPSLAALERGAAASCVS